MAHTDKCFKFKIDHIDPLGQGVFKNGENIYFIPNTLPGDSGIAEVVRSKKGVFFAQVVNIEESSKIRIEPECKHFETCNGCHFLNTTYENELMLKQNSFKKIFSKFDLNNFEVTPALNRFSYRNRIQLHYDKKKKLLGLHQKSSHKIVQIPECKILKPTVQKSMFELYQNQTWLKKTKKKTGHLEIYDNGDTQSIVYDEPYAHLGFSQVNDEMNGILKSKIDNIFDCLDFTKDELVFDLFAGDGNITNSIRNKYSRICFDLYSEHNQNFYSIDLHKEPDFNEIKKLTNSKDVSTFVIDPPRKGFPQINKWHNEFKPKNIIYISCHPQTLARDLKDLCTSYSIVKSQLIDLFPGTYHFESVFLLKRHD